MPVAPAPTAEFSIGKAASYPASLLGEQKVPLFSLEASVSWTSWSMHYASLDGGLDVVDDHVASLAEFPLGPGFPGGQ